jgi:hypothetical protein
MLTLWDLVRQVIPAPKPVAPRRRRPAAGARPRLNGYLTDGRPSNGHATASRPRRQTMEERYDEITRRMLQEHGVRVRRWRRHMSGIAWEVYYRDGRTVKLIEAPRPRGPMSAAVFLHEIGHHAIGFGTYKPRCLEEYHAWVYALRQMEALGLNVTDGVRRRMHNSLRYAVQKANRRGLRNLPPELEPFAAPAPGSGGRHGL